MMIVDDPRCTLEARDGRVPEWDNGEELDDTDTPSSRFDDPRDCAQEDTHEGTKDEEEEESERYPETQEVAKRKNIDHMKQRNDDDYLLSQKPKTPPSDPPSDPDESENLWLQCARRDM
jgi:hypothetical protein